MVQGAQIAPIIREKMVNNLLHHLDRHKSTGLDGIHSKIPRELAELLTETLAIIHQQSWLTGEVPFHWRLAMVMPIYKKEEDPGNYKLVNLTLVLGKVMEQIS